MLWAGAPSTWHGGDAPRRRRRRRMELGTVIPANGIALTGREGVVLCLGIWFRVEEGFIS
jgi:hypothetical protein